MDTTTHSRNRCQRCGESLRSGREVWLEMNTRDATYHEEGVVPPSESQGLFPFGAACAKSTLSNGGRP